MLFWLDCAHAVDVKASLLLALVSSSGSGDAIECIPFTYSFTIAPVLIACAQAVMLFQGSLLRALCIESGKQWARCWSIGVGEREPSVLQRMETTSGNPKFRHDTKPVDAFKVSYYGSFSHYLI